MVTPVKGRDLTESSTEFNRGHAQLQTQGKRAFACLKRWKLLRRVRCCPYKVTQRAAIHVLQTKETGRKG